MKTYVLGFSFLTAVMGGAAVAQVDGSEIKFHGKGSCTRAGCPSPDYYSNQFKLEQLFLKLPSQKIDGVFSMNFAGISTVIDGQVVELTCTGFPMRAVWMYKCNLDQKLIPTDGVEVVTPLQAFSLLSEWFNVSFK